MNVDKKILMIDSVLQVVISMSENCQKKHSPRAALLVFKRRRWCPPVQQATKINIDRAFSPSSNVGAWGVIIRDEGGGVALAGAENMG